MVDELQVAVEEAERVADTYRHGNASAEQLREASYRLASIYIRFVSDSSFGLDYQRPDNSSGWIGYNGWISHELCFRGATHSIVYISLHDNHILSANSEEHLAFIDDARSIIQQLEVVA